jgi:NADH:quinone reductase (non-electrogenic)
VIVGAGFAGLNAAHSLRRADADVTIVDGDDYHTFQPLLYQVSTGYLAPEEVGAALRAVFSRQANVRVRIGKASGLDYPAHALVLQDGSRLDFDYLIVAAGAEANFFGIPGMREHCASGTAMTRAASRNSVAATGWSCKVPDRPKHCHTCADLQRTGG